MLTTNKPTRLDGHVVKQQMKGQLVASFHVDTYMDHKPTWPCQLCMWLDNKIHKSVQHGSHTVNSEAHSKVASFHNLDWSM